MNWKAYMMGDKLTFKNLKTNTGMKSNRQLLFCNKLMVIENWSCDAVTYSIWSWIGEPQKKVYKYHYSTEVSGFSDQSEQNKNKH